MSQASLTGTFPSSTLSKPWSLLNAIKCRDLNPCKNWYPASPLSLCGREVCKLKKMEPFKEYPELLTSVAQEQLSATDRLKWPNTRRQRSDGLPVVSSAGIILSHVRAKDTKESIMAHPSFSKIVNLLDEIPLDALILDPSLELKLSVESKDRQIPGHRAFIVGKLLPTMKEQNGAKTDSKESNQSSMPTSTTPTSTTPSSLDLQNMNSRQKDYIIYLEDKLKKSACTSKVKPSQFEMESISTSTPNQTSSSRKRARRCLIPNPLENIAEKYHTPLSRVLQDALGDSDSSENTEKMLQEILGKLVELKGAKEAIESVIKKDDLREYLSSLRVPDWVLLYFKLSAQMPDKAWQTLLNLTQYGGVCIVKRS